MMYVIGIFGMPGLMFAEEFTILLAFKNKQNGNKKNVTYWLSIRYWLNIMHRCDWERDLSGLVCIKNLHESSLCLSDFR